MPVLKNWFISKEEVKDKIFFVAHGSVFGHPKQYKCPDGLSIHTSPIRNISIQEDTITLMTQNNEYTLEKTKINCEPSKTACLDDFLHAFTNEFNFSVIQSELNEIIERKKAYKLEKAEKLEPGQLYLDLSNTAKYYFNYAIVRDKASEKLNDCEKHIHVGMSQDSVLIYNGYEKMISYFPHKQNSLAFYSSLYEMFGENQKKDGSKILGYIFNSGTDPLYICFSWGKTIKLAPGTELKVSMDNINALPDSELKSIADLYEAQVLTDTQIIFKDNDFPS